jgi:serine O-acetyltransferase
MKSAFLADLRRPHPNIECDTELRRLIQMWRRPGAHAVAVYRFGSWIQRSPLFIRICLLWIYLILERRIRIKWGIELNRNARIGGGFHIDHFGGIFIGWDAQIGENCTIFHDVTFSMVFSGPRRGTPSLGNNVTIYPGAKLVGRITLGNNVVVGPNVVLTRDVPDNGIVMVEAPKIIRMSQSKPENEISME